MEKFLDFITQNYLWFLIIVAVLVLALIGYFVDFEKQQDDTPFRKNKDNVKEESMPEVKIENNISLNEMINNSVNKPNNGQEANTNQQNTNIQ